MSETTVYFKDESSGLQVETHLSDGGVLLTYIRDDEGGEAILNLREVESVSEALTAILNKHTITASLWDEVKDHFDKVRQIYMDLDGVPGINVTPILVEVLEPLAKRYNAGERSQELFDEMKGVQ
jgi:hypothetical protein